MPKKAFAEVAADALDDMHKFMMEINAYSFGPSLNSYKNLLPAAAVELRRLSALEPKVDQDSQAAKLAKRLDDLAAGCFDLEEPSIAAKAAVELRRLEARVAELLEANNREVERRRLMAAALRVAKTQFEGYEQQHLKKGTEEGIAKAATNRHMANTCEKALAVEASESEAAAIEQVNKMASALRTATLALRDISVLKAYHDKEDARRIAKDALNRMHGKLNG